MRADTQSFKFWNLIISCLVAGTLWWLFHPYLHHLFFLLPLFFVMHVRDLRSRLRELNDRQQLQLDVFALLVNDVEFRNNFYDLLDAHGFSEEADALIEKDERDANLS